MSYTVEDYQYSWIYLALQVWGKAEKRIDNLIASLRYHPEDAERIETAIMWYLRVWGAVEHAVEQMRNPYARNELYLRYVKGMKLTELSQYTGYPTCSLQWRATRYSAELEKLIDPEIGPLVIWRYWTCRYWQVVWLKPIRGFERPLHEELVSEYQKKMPRRVIDHREIRKLLQDPGYRLNVQAMIDGPSFVDGHFVWQ